MESGNLFSIISRLMSFNKIEKDGDHLALLEIQISKSTRVENQEHEFASALYAISTTRQLALEQIRYLN